MSAGLNIVSGVRKITHDILSVCLIRKGEDPMHPDFGMAPDIFDPLSSYPAEYWVYHAEQEILKWVAGIESLKIDIENLKDGVFADYRNDLITNIRFIPTFDVDVRVLTFGFYNYQGAIWDRDFNTFLSDIYLDGSAFQRLA